MILRHYFDIIPTARFTAHWLKNSYYYDESMFFCSAKFSHVLCTYKLMEFITAALVAYRTKLFPHVTECIITKIMQLRNLIKIDMRFD